MCTNLCLPPGKNRTNNWRTFGPGIDLNDFATSESFVKCATAYKMKNDNI